VQESFMEGSMKNASLVLSLAAAVLIAASGAYAQSDPLSGSWGISTTGQAALSAPNSGTCNVNGTVPAALYDALIQFARGQVTIRNLGINIGATNCSSPNFQGSGTYTITNKGDGGFEADGTFSTLFVGRPAACSATALNGVSFTVIGKLGDSTATITINGLDSGSYAEGPPAGPTTCSAAILNLTASGIGKKF
jgi:hypothetical protein